MTKADGENALREFARGNYDIVLTGAKIPDMDGYRVAGNVHKGFNAPKRDVSIILLTAEHTPHEALRNYISRCFNSQRMSAMEKNVHGVRVPEVTGVFNQRFFKRGQYT